MFICTLFPSSRKHRRRKGHDRQRGTHRADGTKLLLMHPRHWMSPTTTSDWFQKLLSTLAGQMAQSFCNKLNDQRKNMKQSLHLREHTARFEPTLFGSGRHTFRSALLHSDVLNPLSPDRFTNGVPIACTICLLLDRFLPSFLHKANAATPGRSNAQWTSWINAFFMFLETCNPQRKLLITTLL